MPGLGLLGIDPAMGLMHVGGDGGNDGQREQRYRQRESDRQHFEAIGAPNQRTSAEQEADRPSAWIKRKRLYAIVSSRLRHRSGVFSVVWVVVRQEVTAIANSIPAQHEWRAAEQ